MAKRSNNGWTAEPAAPVVSAGAVERKAGVAVWRQIQQVFDSDIAKRGFGEKAACRAKANWPRVSA
jgi:hypothetical protein